MAIRTRLTADEIEARDPEEALRFRFRPNEGLVPDIGDGIVIESKDGASFIGNRRGHRRLALLRGAPMTADVYYDRSLRLWVRIDRDAAGNGIVNELTGETAQYFGSKKEALS